MSEVIKLLKKAVRATISDYAGNGNHDSDLIAGAFERLWINIEELERIALNEDNPPFGEGPY